MLNTSGTVGAPPAPSFVQQKCEFGITDHDIEWKPIKYDPPITAYVLEFGQNNNIFNEVYRDLETKYHLQGLKPNTSYVLRLSACNEREIGNTALLELKTLNADLNNWTLSMSSTSAELNAENTRESLLDEQFTTGVAVWNGSGDQWIQASFPYPVPVTSVTIAPLHKNRNAWNLKSGNGGSLQYSHNNINWTRVGTIAYVKMQQQKLATGHITAQYWRLFKNHAIGTSSLIFK